MKKFLRLTLLLLGIIFVILCRFMPNLAEGYALMVYPSLSAALSAFSSSLPFPFDGSFCGRPYSMAYLLPDMETSERDLLAKDSFQRNRNACLGICLVLLELGVELLPLQYLYPIANASRCLRRTALPRFPEGIYQMP